MSSWSKPTLVGRRARRRLRQAIERDRTPEQRQQDRKVRALYPTMEPYDLQEEWRKRRRKLDE